MVIIFAEFYCAFSVLCETSDWERIDAYARNDYTYTIPLPPRDGICAAYHTTPHTTLHWPMACAPARYHSLFATATLLFRMPEDEAPHQDDVMCNVCFESNVFGNDFGCSSTETKHWLCSQCVVKLQACPLCRQQHPLCTSWLTRETQD